MPGGAGTPGGYDGGGAGFGGGGGGGEGGAAQRAAAQRAQAQLDADRLNAQRAAAASRAAARENAIQLAALTPKTIEPIRHHSADTPTQIAEQKEIDLYGYQDAKAKAPTTLIPKTKTVTYGRGNPFTIYDQLIPTTVKSTETLFDPRTSQNALLKRPGGIGSFFKNAAMAVVPGLLPAKLAQGYRLAKLGYDLKNRKGVYGTALRLGENLIGKNVGDFIKTGGSQFDRLNPNEMKNVRTFKPTRDRDEERVKTVAERVTTGAGLESGEKLLGVQNTQKAELFKRRSMVENILRKGSYQGRNLTFEQKNNLRNYIEQINKFLVPVQQGI